MASRWIRDSVAGSVPVASTVAGMLVPALVGALLPNVPASVPALRPAVVSAATPPAEAVASGVGGADGAGATTAPPAQPGATAPTTPRATPRATPQVAPRRTVLRQGQPVIFAGRAEPDSTVRISVLLDARWEALTPVVRVRRPGIVRLSASLPRQGRYLVRADVISPDRSTRYGLGPFVVTVAPTGTRLPVYASYSLTDLLRSGRVTSPAVPGRTVQVGGRPFHAEASFEAAAAPRWTAGIVAQAMGCIRTDVEFAVGDQARPASVGVRVVNRWVGRGGQSIAGPGGTGRIATILDGGRFAIEASGGAMVHLRGTVTCPRGALAE